MRIHKTKGAYVSEFEQYMNTFLERHPDVILDQERGWYIWWDHRLDLDAEEKERASEVPPKAYPYD